MRYILFFCIILLCCSCEKAEESKPLPQLTYQLSTLARELPQENIDHLVKMLHEKCGGKIAFIDNEKREDSYHSLVTKKVDIALFSPSELPKRFPINSALSLPLGFSTAVQASEAFTHLRKSYGAPELINFQPLSSFTTAPLNFIAKKRVCYRSDLKNSIVATPVNSLFPLLSSWGAHPLLVEDSALPQSDITATVDAIYAPLATLKNRNFAKEWKNVTITNSVVIPFFLGINHESFAALSPELQKALNQVGKEYALWSAEQFDKESTKALEWAIAEHGITISYPNKTLARTIAMGNNRIIGNWALTGSSSGFSTEEILALLHDE